MHFATDNSNFDLVVKKLSFDEIVLSDFSLPKTSVSSIDSKEYLILDIDNKILRGTLSLPKNGESYPEVDLDFINVNLSQDNSKSTFLNVFNNLDVKLKLKTKETKKNNHSKDKEIGGVQGPEPTRYGDWEKNGRCTDF